jgi:hypothetical protein
MDHSDELYDCAVCDQKTSLRCGGCGELAFCSREHQRVVRLSPFLHDGRTPRADWYSPLQLWKTHKWLCGTDSTLFSLPPLFRDEETALLSLHNALVTETSSEGVSRNFHDMRRRLYMGSVTLEARFFFPLHFTLTLFFRTPAQLVSVSGSC